MNADKQTFFTTGAQRNIEEIRVGQFQIEQGCTFDWADVQAGNS
jgi:hypothetical protein